MRRSLAFTVCTTFLAASAIGTSGPAYAGDGFGAGLFGGLIAGTIVGAAAAGPRYFAPAPVYVAHTCYWTRGAPVWDAYRGIWVRPRIQVCN